MAEREHAFFERAGAVQTPLGVAEGFGVLAFDRGFRGEVSHQFFAKGLVDGEVLGGQDDDASGEAVAEGVVAGSFFPCGTAWSGRFRLVGGFGWRHDVAPRLSFSRGKWGGMAEIL